MKTIFEQGLLPLSRNTGSIDLSYSQVMIPGYGLLLISHHSTFLVPAIGPQCSKSRSRIRSGKLGASATPRSGFRTCCRRKRRQGWTAAFSPTGLISASTLHRLQLLVVQILTSRMLLVDLEKSFCLSLTSGNLPGGLHTATSRRGGVKRGYCVHLQQAGTSGE